VLKRNFFNFCFEKGSGTQLPCFPPAKKDLKRSNQIQPETTLTIINLTGMQTYYFSLWHLVCYCYYDYYYYYHNNMDIVRNFLPAYGTFLRHLVGIRPTPHSTIQEDADIHSCLECDSNPRSQCSSGHDPRLIPRGDWLARLYYFI
jgi:hypothetical protein